MTLVDSGRLLLAAAAFFAVAPTPAAASLSLDLSRVTPESHVAPLSSRRLPGLSKRATVVESIANNITGGGYYIDVFVGTPQQPTRMVLDTGSSDAWVVAADADLCTDADLQAAYFDSCSSPYDSSKSSTYALVDRNGFEIQYLDGSTAEGDYITEDFTIGGTTIKSLQMGVADQTVRGTGILGVGFNTNVAALEVYPNIIDTFFSQGLISTKAYSLWLNDRRSTTGNILFGGIDTNKFIGPMSVIPLVPDVSTRNITSFTVVMTNTTLTFTNATTVDVAVPNTTYRVNGTRVTLGGAPALLDSGTTLTYLPDDMASTIMNAVGAVTDTRETGLTFISCALLNSQPSLTIAFAFGSAEGSTITVPVRDLVLDVLGDIQDLLPTIRGIDRDDVCLFGIQSTDSFGSSASDLITTNFALLGDTFLRSAYVVYDLTHNQIGLAPANLNSTATTVVELNATDTGLPTLTGVASQVLQPEATGTSSGGGSSSTSDSAAAGLGRMGSGKDVFGVMAISGVFALFGSVFFML